MLWKVTLDDGNASHPWDIALVRADNEDQARRLACVAYGDGQTQDDFYKVTATEYEGGLDLQPGHAVEWLN